MNIIEETLNNVKDTIRTLPSIVADAINKDPSIFISEQQRQMLNSERNNGALIGTYKSEAYARKKGRRTVDLKLTNDFQKRIFAKATSSTFEISSTDEKKDLLIKRYNDSIFGLNSKSIKNIEKDNSFRANLTRGIIKSILK